MTDIYQTQCTQVIITRTIQTLNNSTCQCVSEIVSCLWPWSWYMICLGFELGFLALRDCFCLLVGPKQLLIK